MAKKLLICLALLICSESAFADWPKRKKERKMRDMEVRQKKVATVFAISIGIVAMMAIQDGVENKPKK